ncbi:MAG: hypothetical protein AB7G93_10705 [Bdellovibrionales bacterium]
MKPVDNSIYVPRAHVFKQEWTDWPLESVVFQIETFRAVRSTTVPTHLAYTLVKSGNQTLFEGPLTLPLEIHLQPTHWRSGGIWAFTKTPMSLVLTTCEAR